MFRHWQTYGLAAFGLLAVFLTANAYHAGPIAASQSALVLVDPLASILIGVSLFGENLRTAGAWGPLEALSLLVLFVGAITLCTSPLLNPAKVGGAESAEVLTGRYRSGRGPDAGTAVPEVPGGLSVRHRPVSGRRGAGRPARRPSTPAPPPARAPCSAPPRGGRRRPGRLAATPRRRGRR